MGEAFLGGILFVSSLALFALYVLPSLVAWKRQKKNLAAIMALNLLLGWTVLGWVCSLVWALTKDV